MIQEIYLKKALNIKKEYNSIIKGLNRYEKLASNLFSSVERRGEDLKSLKEKIDNKQIHNVEVAKDELMKIILLLEEEAIGIENVINSMNSRIENLKSEEISLHREIKKLYPEMNDDQIRKEVQEYLFEKVK